MIKGATPPQYHPLRLPLHVDERWHAQTRHVRGTATVTSGGIVVEGVYLGCPEQFREGERLHYHRNRHGQVVACLLSAYLADHQVQPGGDRQRAAQDQANHQRQTAEALNSLVRLPVRWTVGLRGHAQGLIHIYLLQDLHELRRPANAFLCAVQRGAEARHDPPRLVDGHGQPYHPAVNCGVCLKVADTLALLPTSLHGLEAL